MKKLTEIFVKLLVFFAVAGIVFILTLINTKLLLFLNWYKIGHDLDKYFALFSGIAYALGSISVVIWYNPPRSEKKRYIGAVILKLAFVLLDGIHVYIYQNVSLDESYIPEVASFVFAFQTVLILYFIGSVVDNILKNNIDKPNIESEFKKLQTDFNVRTGKYNSLKTDFSKLKSEFRENENKLNLLETEIKEREGKIADYESKIENKKETIINLKDELELLQTGYNLQKETIQQKNEHIAMLEKYYFKSERSRILKKNPENRTEEEQKILIESENY